MSMGLGGDAIDVVDDSGGECLFQDGFRQSLYVWVWVIVVPLAYTTCPEPTPYCEMPLHLRR